MNRLEKRIQLAKEINKINNKLMTLGTWAGKESSDLNKKKVELELQRLETFEGKEEYQEFVNKIKSGGKPIWSGYGYTDYVGYISDRPIGGWPEWYNSTEPEWQMKVDTEKLEQAKVQVTVAQLTNKKK